MPSCHAQMVHCFMYQIYIFLFGKPPTLQSLVFMHWWLIAVDIKYIVRIFLILRDLVVALHVG